MAKVGAIILAAGQSSRFAQPKQLVRFQGRTLIEGAVMAAHEGACEPIVVVTGSNSAKIGSALGDKAVSIVENTHWRRGMGSSIRLGMEYLMTTTPDAKAVVLLVCDQPFVTAKIVSDLIAKWSTTGKKIVASSYADTLGVPALFDQSCFKELLYVADEKGAKPVILENADRVGTVLFPEGEIDIDTPNDFASIEPAGVTSQNEQPLSGK